MTSIDILDMELNLMEKDFIHTLVVELEENVITFGGDMSSSDHVDDKRKVIWILGKGPTQGLGENSLYAQKLYLINFTTKVNTKIYLSLHYNGASSSLFINVTETHKFTAKDSEIVPNNACLGNVSKDFSVSNMKH